jgi:hypothetical protein
MIEIVPGKDVVTFLERVVSRPELFSALTLCSPFIDDKATGRLRTVVERAVSAGCAVRIVTRSASSDRVARACGPPRRGVSFVYRDDVHAKAYIAQARPGRGPSEAIVTSANLTQSGLGRNVEMGVRIRTTSAGGRLLFEQVRRSVQDLSNRLN